MRVYFLSSIPCMLTVGGLPLGLIDGHERFSELTPSDDLLIECVAPGYRPVRFFLSERFLLDPPAGVSLYYTRTGTAVFLSSFVREDCALRPLAQKRLGDTLLTLYLQGGVQLSLENGSGFHLIDLPEAFEKAELLSAGGCFLIKAPHNFCILSHEGEVLTLSEGTVSEVEPFVVAEIPFHDSLRHSAVCTYEGGKLKESRIRTPLQPTAATFALAFFESVLIGADPLPFLGEDLQKKAAALGEFLGKFVSVVLTDSPETVGLVYARKERVFDVSYFRVVLGNDGKIANITEA